MPREFESRAGMVQPCETDWYATRPGSAQHKQASFLFVHSQSIADHSIRHRRTHDVFRLGKWRDTAQPGAWRNPGKILIETVGREYAQYVAIFQLNRHTVFLVNEHHVKYVASIRHLQRISNLSIRLLAFLTVHDRRVGVPTSFDFVCNIPNFENM